MEKQIFLNLPVKDLQRSVEFFTKLGFTFDERFRNEQAVCMIVGNNIFVMLLVEEFFRTFTKKPVADASETTEVIICISAESRGKVDEMVSAAINAGGSAPNDKQDHGFMYAHGFEDLDGHVWEVAFMDAAAVEKMSEANQN